MDIEKKAVQKLLKDKEFVALCERLIEEGYNGGHLADAFLILDAIEAGEGNDFGEEG